MLRIFYMLPSDQLILEYLQRNAAGQKIQTMTIANAVNCDKRTVIRSLKRLRDKNLITRYGGGRGRARGFIYEVISHAG